MTRFTEKYSDDQRDAVVSAALDRGATYRRAVELAQAGELTRSNGDKLDPFSIPESYVGDLVRSAKKRRTGKAATQLAQLPPRDAVEALRRRLLSAADHELERYEKRVRRQPTHSDPEILRQIGRALREIAAIPGPSDPRPPKPGQKVNGDRNGSQTQPNATLAGSILADARSNGGSPVPALGTPTQPMDTAHGDTDAGQPAADDSAAHALTAPEPGSRFGSLGHAA